MSLLNAIIPRRGLTFIVSGLKWFGPAILILACAYQSYSLLRGDAFVWARAGWRTRHMPAMERGARFLFGSKGAEYVLFLQRVVPEGAALIAPEGAGVNFEQNVLQFFLMPRGIPACDCAQPSSAELRQACRACLNAPGRFVPVVGDFPPPEVIDEERAFIAFPQHDNWYQGVYAPLAGYTPRDRAGVQWAELTAWQAVLTDVFSILGVMVLGWLVASILVPDLGKLELASVSFPLGGGLLTFGVFLASWALRGELRWWGFISVFSILLGFAAAAKLRFRPSQVRLTRLGSGKIPASNSSWIGGRILPAIILGVVSLIVLSAIVSSVGRAYSTYDGIAHWATKGYAIAYEGSIFAGRRWGGHGLAYPQNLHLLIGYFRMINGDLLPGSKLIFPLLFGSLALGSYSFWIRSQVSSLVAALGTLLVISMPVLFFHATIGFANLPFTAYIVLGTLQCVLAMMERSDRRFALGSLLLGLAAWTRPEGVGFGLALLVVLLLSSWFVPGASPPRWTALLPFVLISVVWLSFGAKYMASDEIGRVLSSSTSQLRAGHFALEPIPKLFIDHLFRFTTPAVWGWAPTAGLILLFTGLFLDRSTFSGWPGLVLAAGLAAFAVPLVMFYAAYYSTGSYDLFLAVSFDRAMFPAWILVIVAAIPVADRLLNSVNVGK